MTESLTDGVTDPREGELPTHEGGVDDHRETILLPVGEADGHRVESLADTAAEVAGMMQADVHVLHVFTPPRFERVVERLDYGPGTRPDPDEVVRRVEPVRDLTRELATPLRNWGMRMDVEGRVGDSVTDEIVAAAGNVDAKRIIVGGRHRTPVGKVVFGSTVQEILLDAPCPVTFVRDA